MTSDERRFTAGPDRRREPRGGRRTDDQPGRHPTVLVADQYEDARAPVARYLDRYNFNVVEAADADQASELAARHRPRAILSGLHGNEAERFYDSLTSPGGERPLVIVLQSGVDETVPAVATAVIAKPFSLRPMLEELRRELRAADARAASAGSV